MYKAALCPVTTTLAESTKTTPPLPSRIFPKMFDRHNESAARKISPWDLGLLRVFRSILPKTFSKQVTNILGLHPFMLYPTYSAVMGPKDIRVNCIAPGIIKTHFSSPSKSSIEVRTLRCGQWL